MAQGINGCEPGAEEEEGGELEANVSCGGFCDGEGLGGGALLFDWCPGAGDDHEKVLFVPSH